METTTVTTPDQNQPHVEVTDLFESIATQGPFSSSLFPVLARSRLARDLHDSVGQALFALLVEIRVAVERGQAGRDDLLVLERDAERAVEALRSVAYRLRSRRSEDALGEARDYGNQLQNALGRALTWVDTRSNPRLASKVAHALAWCIREAITNAVRHGAARSIEVRLRESDGRIQISVRDDGSGFVPQAFGSGADGRGLGMLGCAERMAEVGGVFVIRSRPGEGTLISLEAPRYLRSGSASLTARELSLGSIDDARAAAAVAG